MGFHLVEEKGQQGIIQSYLQWLGQSFFNLSIIFIKKINKTLRIYNCHNKPSKCILVLQTHTPNTQKKIFEKKRLKKGLNQSIRLNNKT
jgi:hypothetical protein